MGIFYTSNLMVFLIEGVEIRIGQQGGGQPPDSRLILSLHLPGLGNPSDHRHHERPPRSASSVFRDIFESSVKRS